MTELQKSPPVVLVFSAHDPCGGAGIQADIESINRNGARCVSVLTALTAQNTREFDSILPQNLTHFRRQAELLLTDIDIYACKIGLTGSVLLTEEIARLLSSIKPVPLVVDPVLQSGSGKDLSREDIITAITRRLLPMTTLLTPNIREAMLLTGRRNKQAAAQDLLDMGCRAVLITGTDQTRGDVINTLYEIGSGPVEFNWPRLPGTYHGSGCTLASAIAARLASGEDPGSAVQAAQEYTWNTLKHGYSLGTAQLHPDRNFPI